MNRLFQIKKWLALPVLAFSTALGAQNLENEAIDFFGGIVEKAGGSLSYSTAEVAVEHVLSQKIWLTQGFEQPNYDAAPVFENLEMPNSILPDDGADANRFFDPVGFLNRQSRLQNPLDSAAQISRETARIVIFERSGEVVFRADPYSNLPPEGWNGKSQNGRELPTGVYFFILEFGSGQSRKGPIHVFRK